MARQAGCGEGVESVSSPQGIKMPFPAAFPLMPLDVRLSREKSR